MYYIAHETSQFALKTSRLGDVVMVRKIDGAEQYFQTGEDSEEIHDLIDAHLPDQTIDYYCYAFFCE